MYIYVRKALGYLNLLHPSIHSRVSHKKIDFAGHAKRYHAETPCVQDIPLVYRKEVEEGVDSSSVNSIYCLYEVGRV